MVKTETLDNLQLAMTKMSATPQFWVDHASFHPNYRRVKNWLWVHDRYRNQAQGLLQIVQPKQQQQQQQQQQPSSSSSETAMTDGAFASLKTAFSKFHKKIEAHSEFEDTQLFKFFLDAQIGNQPALQRLMEQHKDLRTVQAIQDGLDNGADYETVIQPNLERYIKDLLEHLQLEEQTLIGPWLHLSLEEYKKYRSYLSWTYCVMY